MGWLSGQNRGDTETVVIAGGGTGGHLYPGMAVAEAIEERDPSVEIAFVGTADGIEARVIPDTQWPLHTMDVPKLKGQGVSGWLKGGLSLGRSGVQAMNLLRTIKPSLVISVGGYAAGPFTLAAAADGVPTVLIEQNLRPGMTNRALAKTAKRAFVAFESTCDDFENLPCEWVGNPVRRAIRDLASNYEYEAPDEDEPIHVLVTGGSGGARSLNERLPGALCGLGERATHVQVRHQYGRNRRDEVEGRYAEFPGDAELVEFIDAMDEAYRWSDLVICRAGGTTIAELMALAIPAVYVPSPHVTDDQQTKNARQIVEAGAGLMLPDDAIGSSRATNLIGGLIANPISLQNISDQARGFGRPDAAGVIAEQCLRLIAETH
jgi:UDP-N-acetylglucosamine--N-acetylmuramyl-(pentapeptide) pyrophosphoryl-undecaprenol N-acetylglucosamine transferase